MAINLNNTSPAAPSGSSNVLWQQDGSGNISASLPNGVIQKVSITSTSGAIILDCSTGNSFLITLHENITSLSIINPTYDGLEITILWQQNSTGGYTVTFPTGVQGGTAPSAGANTYSAQKFTYNLADTIWFACAAGITGM
jgi:hypothetical protein